MPQSISPRPSASSTTAWARRHPGEDRDMQYRKQRLHSLALAARRHTACKWLKRVSSPSESCEQLGYPRHHVDLVTMEDITRIVEGPGCTVIVISYDRPHALESLLRGLSAQRLRPYCDGVDRLQYAEHVPAVFITRHPGGVVFWRLFPDVKIMNSAITACAGPLCVATLASTTPSSSSTTTCDKR